MPRLAIFDLDGTITRHDTLLRYLVGYLCGQRPARLWRAPLCLLPLLQYCLAGTDRGRLKSRIIRLTLGGLPRSELERWNRIFIARLLHGGVYAEALAAIEAQRAVGAQLVLLSASPDLYVPAIAAALGFDTTICTELRWRADGRLDGALQSANRRGAEKVRCVRSLLQSQAPDYSCAYGNSRADLPHLRLVSDGVYVNGSARDLRRDANLRLVRWTTAAVAPRTRPDHNRG